MMSGRFFMAFVLLRSCWHVELPLVSWPYRW